MLTWADIESFLNSPNLIKEKLFLECKKASNSLPKDFWRSFSAFSNTQGGFILLGVSEDNGTFKITGVNNPQKIVDDLFSQARGNQKISYHYLDNSSVKYNTGIFNKKNVIAVYVQRAETNNIPVHLNGDITQSYIRLNTGDHKLSQDELRNCLSSYTRNDQDNKVINHTSIDDIHLPTLQKYRQYIKNHNLSSELLALDDLPLLKKINAFSKDLKTGNEGLTFAGLLMFGQLHIIRSLLPNYLLDYQVKESDGRYDHRITCDDIEEGNLFEFYLKVAPYLSDIGKNRHFSLTNLTRTEENQITESLREAFINTLTHSDYFNDSITVKIVKSSNKLVFQNPGAMLVTIEEAMNGMRSNCRNAILHNMFRRIGLCEREGKGIETIFNNWRKKLLTMPELNTNYEKTELLLTLQDTEVLNACQKLEKEFGDKYENLSSEIYKHILIATVLNDNWINHSVLIEQFNKDYHSRDITLALSKLEKDKFLIGQGEKKEKFYTLPWASDMDLSNIYAQGQIIIFNELARSSNSNIDENLPDQLVLHTYNLDQYGRIITDKNDVVINDLESLKPAYKQHLKEMVSLEFFNTKMKKAKNVDFYISQLCNQQFVSRRVLAELLGISDSALRSHLRRLVKDKKLELAFPQQQRHKDQAYRWISNN